MMFRIKNKRQDSLAAVNRVRDLHKKITHAYGKVACRECGQVYPCLTIQAIDQKEKGA